MGEATATWLKANNHTVVVYDIKKDTLTKLKEQEYCILKDIQQIKKQDPDVIWICTAEWDVEESKPRIRELMRRKHLEERK